MSGQSVLLLCVLVPNGVCDQQKERKKKKHTKHIKTKKNKTK